MNEHTVWEVFRQERRGQPFEHAGSVVAPDADFAEAWAREQYGRRGESVALWLVPRDQIRELGLEVPDPKLRKREDGTWEFTEPDWDELKHVVTGHGPKTEERLAFRKRFLDQEQWVRDALAA